MTAELDRPSPHVPASLIRTIWMGHRALHRLTRGGFLREPAPGRWGMLRLTTVGRRTGRSRVAILGYIEDGGRLAIPAMNGWQAPDPAWWLNLQAQPEATVVLPTGETRRVVARAADPAERDRLWQALVDLGTAAYTHANARQRPQETAIVVLEPSAD